MRKKKRAPTGPAAVTRFIKEMESTKMIPEKYTTSTGFLVPHWDVNCNLAFRV